MAIRLHEYKGFCVDPNLKIEKPQGFTTGLDKFPEYEDIIGDNEEEEEPPKSKKQQRKLEKQQKKVRASKRKIQLRFVDKEKHKEEESEDKHKEESEDNHKEKNHKEDKQGQNNDDYGYEIPFNIKRLYHRLCKHVGHSDVKLLHYHSVSFYASDLKYVLPGEWINDNIICLVFEYLSQIYLQNTKEISLIYPSIIQLVLYSDAGIITKDDFPNAKFIFLPINDSEEGDHWFLGLLDLLQSKLFIYDSMISDNSELIKKLVHKLQKAGIVSGKVKVVVINCQQQGNSDDCGIYLIMITCYLVNMMMTEPINFDIAKVRFSSLRGRWDIMRLVSYLLNQEKTIQN